MKRAIDKLDNSELHGRRIKLVEDKAAARRRRRRSVEVSGSSYKLSPINYFKVSRYQWSMRVMQHRVMCCMFRYFTRKSGY